MILSGRGDTGAGLRYRAAGAPAEPPTASPHSVPGVTCQDRPSRHWLSGLIHGVMPVPAAGPLSGLHRRLAGTYPDGRLSWIRQNPACTNALSIGLCWTTGGDTSATRSAAAGRRNTVASGADGAATKTARCSRIWPTGARRSSGGLAATKVIRRDATRHDGRTNISVYLNNEHVRGAPAQITRA